MIRIFKSLLLASAVFALAGGVVACGGDVCEDAAEICGAGDTDDEEEGEEAECTGAAETLAQCIVDADSCSAETLADCAS